MAECGIEKYDELPGRVGWIDVDSLCYALYRLDHPLIKNIQEIPILQKFATPPEELQKYREKIIAKLEKAYEAEHHGERTSWKDLFI